MNWLRSGINQNILGNVDIEGSMYVDTYQQNSWTVSNIDVNSLLESAVKTDEDKFFSSLHLGKPRIATADCRYCLINSFPDHVNVDNINVNGSVQKRHVSEEFVSKFDNLQTITGNKRFKGPITLDSIHVANQINGEMPSKLCECPSPPQSSKWIIRGDTT